MPGPQGGGGLGFRHLGLREDVRQAGTPGSEGGGGLDSGIRVQNRPGVQILGSQRKKKDEGLDSWLLGGGTGRDWGLKWTRALSQDSGMGSGG